MALFGFRALGNGVEAADGWMDGWIGWLAGWLSALRNSRRFSYPGRIA